MKQAKCKNLTRKAADEDDSYHPSSASSCSSDEEMKDPGEPFELVADPRDLRLLQEEANRVCGFVFGRFTAPRT